MNIFDRHRGVTYVRGSEMPIELQRLAMSRYVHRFTGTHRPQWARGLRDNGKPYWPQFADDWEWISNTFFPVTKRGELGKGDCYSTPTWPQGPEGERRIPGLQVRHDVHGF